MGRDPRETAPVTHVCFLVIVSAGLLAQRHPASNYFKTQDVQKAAYYTTLPTTSRPGAYDSACRMQPSTWWQISLRASHVLSEGPEGCMEHCCVRHTHIGRD